MQTSHDLRDVSTWRPPQADRYDAMELVGAVVEARDGEIGKVHDLYFEDDAWAVRYLVVDTGGWLIGRKVLVSPHAVLGVTPGERVHLDLRREQVEQSPDFDHDKPVSRQYETAYHAHYGYPHYWVGPYAWGLALHPGAFSPPPPAQEGSVKAVEARLAHERERSDPHLRSAREVRGYAVEANDGTLGNVESFLVDRRSWRIEGIVTDTRNWLPGKHVAISIGVVRAIELGKDRVVIDMSKDAIRALPEYDSP